MAQKSGGARDEANLVQFKLRMKEDLRAKIEEGAARSGNSMNSEIIERLDQSFELDAHLTRASVRALLIEIARQIARAEAATGQQWDSDAPTFRVCQLLVADTFRQARPAFMDEEVRTLLQQQEVLLQRRKPLVDFLQTVGALGHPNALAAYLPSDTTPLPQLPEEEWRNPKSESHELSEEDRAFVRDRISEYLELQGDLDALHPALDAQMDQFRSEKATADLVYRNLTGREPLTMLGRS